MKTDYEKGPLSYHGAESVNRIVNALCGFEWNGCDFMACPQRPFRPKGLVIWDAPKDALFNHAVINNTTQLIVSCAGIPTRFFAYGDSYEQIAAMLDKGLEPPAWGTWDTVYPPNYIKIRITCGDSSYVYGPGNGVSLAMWGKAIR